MIKMMWGQNPTEHDVRKAFHIVNSILSHSPRAMYVLVDITSKPNFPMMTTVKSAYNGPYSNPNMREWLIVGSHRMAQLIEHTLGLMTGIDNVKWFPTEADALNYAHSHLATQEFELVDA
jgi:hypothetical protein